MGPSVKLKQDILQVSWQRRMIVTKAAQKRWYEVSIRRNLSEVFSLSLSWSAQEWKCLHVLARCSEMSSVVVAEGAIKV